MRIEPVKMRDAKRLLSIYTYYIKNSHASLEQEIPSRTEFEKQMKKICRKYPFLKAVDDDGKILGYAYLTEHESRAANDWTAQVKLHFDEYADISSVGSALYEELEKSAAEMGILNLSACVIVAKVPEAKGESGKESTKEDSSDELKLFEKKGYTETGRFHNSGYKLNSWHDTVWMEKALGEPAKSGAAPVPVIWQNRKLHGGYAARRLRAAVIVLALIVLLPLALCVYFYHNYYSRTNYVATKEYTVAQSIAPEVVYTEEAKPIVVEEAVLESEPEAVLVEEHEQALENLSKFETNFEDGIYNMLLIGVDQFSDANWHGNSDVMLLVTVNDYTKTIFMTSFLRDLYANIPGVGVRKLNAACAYGGPQLTVETLESNYGVKIDNWALVDLDGMREVIDVCGGIYLDVSEEEANVANTYIKLMCEKNGENFGLHKFYFGGYQYLDGYMAVGYSRNRYTGNTFDFGRTERQRKVLNALIKRVMTSGITTIRDTITEALPYVTHDVTQSRLTELLLKVPTWLGYTVIQQHIPYDNEWSSQNEILVPSDLEKTIQRLTRTIYAKHIEEKEEIEEAKDPGEPESSSETESE